MRTRALGLGLALLTLPAFTYATAASMWMGKVAGKDGAALSGDVQMNPGSDANTTVVELTIKGDAASGTRPWHIHIGSCAKPGGVLGGGRSYTPIALDASGNGTSKATLPIAMPDTGSYYVNIHEGAANMSKIVGCGDLMFHKM